MSQSASDREPAELAHDQLMNWQGLLDMLYSHCISSTSSRLPLCMIVALQFKVRNARLEQIHLVFLCLFVNSKLNET